jgi:hypothetical protein
MQGSQLLIITGVLIALVGVVLKYVPQLVTWFGRLPGDIAYQGSSVTVWFPLTSLIILNFLLYLVFRITSKG